MISPEWHDFAVLIDEDRREVGWTFADGEGRILASRTDPREQDFNVMVSFPDREAADAWLLRMHAKAVLR